MWRQGIFSARAWGGTKYIRTQALHGPGFSFESKFMQVRESSKMYCGLQGVFGERPYPPSFRNWSSNLKTSKRSRSSFCIFHLPPAFKICTEPKEAARTDVTLQSDGHQRQRVLDSTTLGKTRKRGYLPGDYCDHQV